MQQYRQVRGFDLQLHAVDPVTGDALCGQPRRKLADRVGGQFRARLPKACPACATQAETASRRRTSGRRT